MAELSELEKELKKLIEERNSFKPNYIDINKPIERNIGPRKLKDGTVVYTSLNIPEEKLEEYHRMGKMGMFMGIPEHGQPYKTPIHKTPVHKSTSDMDITLMVVAEHGQPHRSDAWNKPMFTTNMEIHEHGRPYKTPIRKEPTDMDVTYMGVIEHGRPYMSDPQPFQGLHPNLIVGPWMTSSITPDANIPLRNVKPNPSNDIKPWP